MVMERKEIPRSDATLVYIERAKDLKTTTPTCNATPLCLRGDTS
jgi:hypothetical protein